MKNILPHPVWILAVLLILFAVSCVTPGDLSALQANMDDFQGGVITKPEFDAQNQEIMAEVESRTERLKEQAGKIPTDPVSLLTYLGGMLGTAYGTTRYRDGRRKARQEPV